MIKNREQLLSHGCIEGRRLAADIVDTALREVDPYKATKKTANIELLTTGKLPPNAKGKLPTFSHRNALRALVQAVKNGAAIDEFEECKALHKLDWDGLEPAVSQYATAMHVDVATVVVIVGATTAEPAE